MYTWTLLHLALIFLLLDIGRLRYICFFLTSSLYLGNEKRGNSETERVDKSPHISNCSVASDYLGKFFIVIIFIYYNNAIFLTCI